MESKIKETLPEVLKKLIANDPLFRTKKNDGVNYTLAARTFGLQQPTLKRILDGDSSSPRKSNLDPICNYFGITERQLHGQDPLNLVTKNRDQTRKDALAAAVKQPRHRLNVDVPVTVYKALKIKAITENKSITDLVNGWAYDYLNTE